MCKFNVYIFSVSSADIWMPPCVYTYSVKHPVSQCQWGSSEVAKRLSRRRGQVVRWSLIRRDVREAAARAPAAAAAVSRSRRAPASAVFRAVRPSRAPPARRAAHGGRDEPAPLARGYPAAQRRARGPPRASRQVPQRPALALRAAARHRRHRLVLLQVWNLMRYVSLPGHRRDHIDSPPAKSLEVCGCLFTCCCFVKLKLSNYAVEGRQSLISFCNIWALRVTSERVAPGVVLQALFVVIALSPLSARSSHLVTSRAAPLYCFTNYCFTALEH